MQWKAADFTMNSWVSVFTSGTTCFAALDPEDSFDGMEEGRKRLGRYEFAAIDWARASASTIEPLRP
jgi:hypothetical protein